MKNIKYRNWSGMAILAVILLSISLAGIMFFAGSYRAKAVTQPTFAVQKVFLPDAYATDSDYDPKLKRHIESTAVDISNGQFVMLNTNADTRDDDAGLTVVGREAVFITFSGVTLLNNVSLRFNGTVIEHTQFDADSEDISIYNQYLHALTPTEVTDATPALNNDYITKYTRGTEPYVNYPEGKYDITIQYRDKSSSQTQTWTYSFYITTQNTYSALFEKATFNDTEKFELANQTSSMLHYFNFNNSFTTIYDENNEETIRSNAEKDQLYYPQMFYNPEKYEIKYTRTLYNYVENVSLAFNAKISGSTEYGELVVTTSTNSGLLNTRTYRLEKGLDGYKICIQFDRVGEYLINKTARLRTGILGDMAQYALASGEVVTSNADLLKSERLVINGYSARYADTRTTTAPLYDNTYCYQAMQNPTTTPSVIYAHDFLTASNEVIKISNNAPTLADTVYTADFSFQNENAVTSQNGITLDDVIYDSNGILLNNTALNDKLFNQNSSDLLFNLHSSLVEKASTNLAPVMFEFNGKMIATSASWYAYRDSLGNISVQNYTRDFRFQNAGTYIVYITYENLVYESGQVQNNGKNYQYHHQVFYFEITNSTPQIEVFATDNPNDIVVKDIRATALNMEDYTNKYVYCSWEATGPFDAKISTKYYIYDWDGKLLGQSTINGLVYQKGKNGTYYNVSTTSPTILCGETLSWNGVNGIDGTYCIQAFREDSPNAFVNYIFQIDTSPITGISALQVMGKNLLPDANNQATVISSLSEFASDFHIATNNSFAWTWNDKKSGAQISAKYIYSSLQTVSDFSIDLESYINNMRISAQNGAVLMKTNGNFGGFTPPVDYYKVDANSLNTPLSSSQIISSPQLAILLLSDEAGNTEIFVTILDTTKTQILQKPAQSAFVNVITDDTEFYWGTHKSLSITDTTSVENTITDIFDFAQNDFVWTLNGQTYKSNSIIKNAFAKMDILNTRSIVIELDKIEIASDTRDDKDIIPYIDDENVAHNWFAIIKVNKPTLNEPNKPYTTQVYPDGMMSASHPLHTLTNEQFGYTFIVSDIIGNHNEKFYVEVNLDRSRGAMYSYSAFEDSFGSDLTTSRTLENTTIRQLVSNSFSTNRRYVTFSWTEPTDYFQIESVVLKYYPFSYNKSNKNYPYSDEYTEKTLFSDSTSYDTLYNIDRNGATYYQTKILMPIDYVQAFNNGTASSEGMYVITRKYKETTESQSNLQLTGDVLEKTYTYYIDRNAIIPSSTTDYGSDISLKFGYNKGDYADYPNYGGNYFNQFSRTTNSENFNSSIKLGKNTQDPAIPSNVVIDSNILPASVYMSTWKESTTSENGVVTPDANSASVYDKYYFAPEPTLSEGEATVYLNNIFDKYRNSSRVQVAVQYFRHTSGTSYAYTGQTFYSNVYTNASSDNACKSLDKLRYAFNGVGKYRVILFDLSNFQGVLTGNASFDFENLTYGNNLAPNSTVFNFELTGTPPQFTFQSGENAYTNIDTTFNNITNDKNVRITWLDPTDDYSAQIAFNDVIVTKSVYTKVNPKIDENGNQNIGLNTKTFTFSNPILLTCDANEYERLKQDTSEIEGTTFIYKETQTALNNLLNASMAINETKFYKMNIDGVYNYYILLPKPEFENAELYGTKLVDVEYSATAHFISKNNGSEYELQDYQTTQTIYVDNTAPYQNLINLIKNDLYIQSLGSDFANYLINNIDNPQVTFLKSYAFAVEKNFVLNYLNDYESGINYYFRKYDSYNGNPNEQTVIEGQPDASPNASHKFSPTSAEYTIARYKTANMTEGLTYISEVGYYDIIEQDRAGNKRVYTIFVTESKNSIDASIGLNHYFIDSNIDAGTTVTYDNNILFNRNDTINFNSDAFRIESITNDDAWQKYTFKNLVTGETEVYYLAPINIPMYNGNIVSSLDEIKAKFNAFVERMAVAGYGSTGSRIQVIIDDRIDANNNINFYVNTQGLDLIPDEKTFLTLITVNDDGTFTIRLPDTSAILSTQLVDFKVYLNNALQVNDSNLKPLPLTSADFKPSDVTEGFTFNLSTGSNLIYKFEFTDNFGRITRFSYPIDESLIKYIVDWGTNKFANQVFNNETYAYTSSETQFVYQSNALRIRLSVKDLDNNKAVLYTNVANGRIVALDTKSPYFKLELDDLTSSITTLTFYAPMNIHYLYEISVDNYTDTATNFVFAIYTYFPKVALTDTAGSPLLNQVTSKSVLISWVSIDAMFNPYVTLVLPNGVESTITSPTTVDAEGVYTVNIYNSFGKFTAGSQTFTIRSYDVAVYGVNQINSDGTTKALSPHSTQYNYTILGVKYTMPHYFFLSSDSNWDRTIEIICNEDKGLSYRVVATNGNTRIYNVSGNTTHILSTYFAVTRIPSDNISSNTDFRINNEIMSTNLKNIYTKVTDTETAKAVLTWNTTFLDKSVFESGLYDYIYNDFYYLELWYNGVKVGTYTSGSITLTESGVYTISVKDAVGQTQYFGSGYSEFTLTIINDVVYYVNNLAPIQFATFSKDVDLYIPLTFSGDLRQYDSMAITITRNNVEYQVKPTNGHYIFTEPGVYNVSMRGSIKSIVGTNSADLLANYQFTILSSTEAISSYEFSSMTGYEIIKITRSGVDITDEVRGENAKIHTFYADPDTYGVGKYEITVRYAGSGYNPSQDYTFNFWINNEEPTINSSRQWGSSSTSGFTITVNPASIYERVGDCYLVINNERVLTIDATNGTSVDPLTFTYTDAKTYVIQIQSASGNILTSNRITISVPLNTAAIILIVVAVIVFVALVITFIVMRTRMKVK